MKCFWKRIIIITLGYDVNYHLRKQSTRRREVRLPNWALWLQRFELCWRAIVPQTDIELPVALPWRVLQRPGYFHELCFDRWQLPPGRRRLGPNGIATSKEPPASAVPHTFPRDEVRTGQQLQLLAQGRGLPRGPDAHAFWAKILFTTRVSRGGLIQDRQQKLFSSVRLKLIILHAYEFSTN